MAKKVFKRGRFWYFRIFADGRDLWRSTKKTNRGEAQIVADAAADAAAGKGDVQAFFNLLLERIAALPETEQPEIRQQLARQLMMLRASTLPLEEAWATWIKSPAKGDPGAATMELYRGYWNRFTGWAKGRGVNNVHEVCSRHAEDYAGDLWGSKISPRTFNGHVVFLRGMFNVLKNKAGILENPWEGVKLLKKQTQGRENFTPEELSVICRRATGAMRCMIGVGLYTGLRLGDVINLRWADIHKDRIEITPRKTARSGKKITLPIHPVLELLLNERREQVKGEYVFPDEVDSLSKDKSGPSKRFQSFLKECGINTTEAAGAHRKRVIVRKGFHSLRHSFVSLCAANRVPQVAIQDLVGHGSPAMTALYSHADFEQKQSAIAQLPAMTFEGEALPAGDKEEARENPS